MSTSIVVLPRFRADEPNAILAAHLIGYLLLFIRKRSQGQSSLLDDVICVRVFSA